VRCSRAALGHDRRSRLALEHAGVRAGHVAEPVDQRLRLGRKVGEVDGRADDHAVGGIDCRDALVDRVVATVTLPVLALATLEAGRAALRLLAREFDEFGLDPFGLQHAENTPQQVRGVPVLARASRDSNYLHHALLTRCTRLR